MRINGHIFTLKENIKAKTRDEMYHKMSMISLEMKRNTHLFQMQAKEEEVEYHHQDSTMILHRVMNNSKLMLILETLRELSLLA